MKKIIIDIAFWLQLPVVIKTDETQEHGYLSTKSNNPFGKFYLHEKPMRKYISRAVFTGKISEIKKINLFI